MSPDNTPGGHQDRPIIFVPNRPDATPQTAAPNRPDAAARPTVDTTTRNTPEADNDLRAQFALLEAQNRAMANITTALMEQQKTTMAAWAAERAANTQVVTGLTGQLTELATRTAEASVSLRETAQLQRENIMIPETEWPRNEAGWAAVIRAKVTEHRKLGESPYSGYKWFQDLEIKPWLAAAREAERRLGLPGLREKLVTELVATQNEDQVYGQWGKFTGTLDNAEKLNDQVTTGGVTLGPDMLIGLSNLAATETKPWLVEARRISDGTDRTESISRETSRATYAYLKLFGEWADAKENILLGPQGAEAKMKEKWVAGAFHGDLKTWESAVGDTVKAMMEGGKVEAFGNVVYTESGAGWTNGPEAARLNQVVLEKLGFGTDGKVKKAVLTQMFAAAPEDVRKTYAFKTMARNVAALGRDTDGLTMFDLMRIAPAKIEKDDAAPRRRDRVWPADYTHVNMFSDNVKKDQVAYTRWVVQGLTGSDYAEESALRLISYTGEGAEMNVEGVPGSYKGDITWILCHPERRRIKEVRNQRMDGVGPLITLGRYEVSYPNPDGSMHYGRFSESWLRGAELVSDPDDGKKAPILNLIREGKWLDRLPWDRLSDETYGGDFFTQFNHAIASWKAIADSDTPLYKDKDALMERVGGRNKNLQNAFAEWDAWKIPPKVLYPERTYNNQQTEEWKKQTSAFEKRDEYASYLLGKDLKIVGQRVWSPWVVYMVGMIATHTGEEIPIPDAIQSPTGIKMVERAPFSSQWSTSREKYEGQKPTDPNSIPELLERAVARKFLTKNEAKLVVYMFQGKIVDGGKLNLN